MAAGPTVAPSKASPTNRKRVDVAILGARMHYAVARILAQADLLGTLYTDTYLGNKPVLGGFLRRVPPRYRPTAVRKLLGREAQGVPAQRIVSFDTLGLKAGWSRRRIRSRGELLELNVRIAKEFCDRVVRCGFGDAGAVYALNWEALEIFREARRRGLFTILEQIIAPAPVEYDLLAAETRRWPGAQDRAAVDPANNPLVRRGEAEWPLADCIVCGSEFVAQSLVSQGVDPRRCHVIPYGVDTSVFHPRREPGRGDELKVLFVGAVGLRKGVPYLLEALRKLKGASLQCRLA